MMRPVRALVIHSSFLLILCGIALRVWKFGELAMFGHDTSRDIILTYKLYKFGEIIYRGPVFSVVWGYLSPLYYYILFPIHFAFNFHPLSSAILMNAVSIICVVCAFYVSAKILNYKYAVIAVVVFAFSFISARTAGSGLNPSVMPPLAVMVFYYMYGFVQERQGSLLKMIIVQSLLLNFHPSGAFFIPIILIIYAIYQPKFSTKEILLSFAAFFAIGFLPYLAMEKKMGWFTVKQIWEYLDGDARLNNNLFNVTGALNFIDALLKNTSYMLFGEIVKYYSIYSSVIYIFLAINFKGILKSIKTKSVNPIDLLGLTIILYILIFYLIVPFEENSVNRLWFSSCFIPLICLYFSYLLCRISIKKYFYAGYSILAVYVIVNLSMFYNMQGWSDSYLHRKEIANFVRTDSQGADFDIYGSNAEPINYIVWFNESDPMLKEKYFKWINWTKKKNSNLGYMIVNPDVATPDFRSVGEYLRADYVYTTSIGYKIIKIEK